MADIELGNAAFVIGEQAVPIAIIIPQYAWHRDSASSARSPVIVIQAERAGQIEAVGYKPVGSDSFGVATLAEMVLLGKERPK